MSAYMTEEEQIESIKKWWKKYGHYITIFLSFTLLFIAGYRYLHWHHEKVAQQASIAYEQMMLGVSNQNVKAVKSYANDLIENHRRSVYADVAHMTLAKIYVSKNQLNSALSELQNIVKESKISSFRQIAKIRIARILVSQKSYQNALKELSSVENSIYLPVINELKGDVYSSMGQYQEALNSYKQALDEVKTNKMEHLFLEMKANELANKSQSMLSDDKKIQAT